jgi:hypothetical protein
MARNSRSRARAAVAAPDPEEDASNQQQQEPQGRSVAAHVRERQRAVAEREASRLARPEARKIQRLAHADRKKSAVTSTPFGIIHRSSQGLSSPAEEEEWCGPWSVARQMIAQREDAKRNREEELQDEQRHPLDDLMDLHDLEQQKRAHPSMTWKGNLPASLPSSTYAKRQKRVDTSKQSSAQTTIPSLHQLCVQFVVANFDDIESLGYIDNDVRVSISKELVARNKLDGQAFETLCEPNMETLEIIDCAGISQNLMAKQLQESPGLRYLLLTHAGRCFGPSSVQSLLTVKPSLCCLSISGAYLLKDLDAATLIRANKETLQSLEFKVSPLLGDECCKAISETRDLLELSLQDLDLTKEALRVLATASDAMAKIKSLQLPSMPGMTDDLVLQFLQATGGSLETLNLSHNYDLTDSCLSGIRQFNIRLRSLNLTGLKEVTAAGLETLFTYDLPGLPPPPKLKVLKLGSCDHQAVTDEVMELVTASASAKKITTQVISYHAASLFGGGGIVQLDLQGSTLVTDATLEHLAETSATTLQELNVSYCPLISDKGLGYLVGKTGAQFTKIECWGCAQLSDEFFDGHGRVQDGTLNIVGAWMKKSGTRSLR